MSGKDIPEVMRTAGARDQGTRGYDKSLEHLLKVRNYKCSTKMSGHGNNLKGLPLAKPGTL